MSIASSSLRALRAAHPLPSSKSFLTFCLAVVAVFGSAAVARASVGPVTTLTVTAAGNSVTTVASGTTVTLTATVVENGPVSPGRVNFCDASAAHCTDIHLLGTAQLTSDGKARLSFRPGIGSHSYNAVFPAQAGHSSSSSDTVSLTVTGQFPTITSITSSGSAAPYSLTATVVGSASSAAPTGTVSFLDTSNANYVLGSADLGTATSALSFLNSANPGTGGYPYSVAVGDFNGDGIADLVTANFFGGATVLLGKGDGTFNAGSTTGAGGYPMSVAVGDFNGDGIADLAVANFFGTVTVLLGNGDGTFNAGSSLAIGGNPRYVAVGDFNGDGIADLATVLSGWNTVAVSLGKGDGTFTSGAGAATGGFPYSVAVGDFNEDGIADMAAANANSNSVTVSLGKGDGSFTTSQTPATGGNPHSVAVGDFNGDGIADLATANTNSNSVTVLLGKGDGTFTTSQTPATDGTPQSVAVGDFNGDGIADLATANAANTVTVLLGKGDGTFTAASQSPATGGNPMSVAVGDFNGDGIADLATANQNSNTATVLLTETQTITATANNIWPVGTGTHNVEASYPGDTSYSSSTSSTTPLTASPISTALRLNANPISSTYGQQVLLTAILSPYSAQGQSTNGESITFYSGATSLGTGTLSSGVATLNVTTLPAGQDSLTASYPGDTNFTQSRSTALPFTVSPLLLTASPSSQTFKAPGTAPVTLTLQPVSGFSGSVTLSCSGLPSGAVCPGLPHTYKLNGKSTVTFSTGVQFPKGTAPNVYTITFSAMSGQYKSATTVTINLQ